MSNTYNQCFDLLLQAEANVNGKGRNLLVESFDYEDVTYMDKLIKAGAKVNVFRESGDTPLMLVSLRMHKDEIMAERVALLLKSGARINYKNRIGLNALTAIISRYGEKRNVEMILLATGEELDTSANVLMNRLQTGVKKIPQFLEEAKLKETLMQMCRVAVQDHLIRINPHLQLFGRISKLGLPSLVTEYLLFDVSLDTQFVKEK